MACVNVELTNVFDPFDTTTRFAVKPESVKLGTVSALANVVAPVTVSVSTCAAPLQVNVWQFTLARLTDCKPVDASDLGGKCDALNTGSTIGCGYATPADIGKKKSLCKLVHKHSDGGCVSTRVFEFHLRGNHQ